MHTHTLTHTKYTNIYVHRNNIHTYDRLRGGNWTAWHGRHHFIVVLRQFH